MIPKGVGCEGCPALGWGRWMVPDERREGAQVELWGQNPGEYEERGQRCVAKSSTGAWTTDACASAPFLGPTGYTIFKSYAPVAGLSRDAISLHNVIRCRQHGTNDLPPLDQNVTKQIIQHCQAAYYRPTDAKLVIAEGAYALYAATGEDGGWNSAEEKPRYKGVGARSMDGWRGWVLPYTPFRRGSFTDVYTPLVSDRRVLAMFHTAFLFRAPWYLPAAKRDWARVPQILRGAWPEPLPPLDPSHPSEWPAEAAFDTEFHTEYGRQILTRYSMFTDGVGGPHLWVVESDGVHNWPIIRSRPRVIMHNIEADYEHFYELTGTRDIDIEDTMFAHACNWSDLDHDLDFLGSMDARINRWKHLMRTNPRVYAGGDAVGTWDAWQSAKRSFRQDPDSEKVYRTQVLPLFPIIARARTHGVRVDGARVLVALDALDEQCASAERVAQAWAGWPLGLGSSQQVAKQLYDVEGLGAKAKGRH